MGDKSAFVGIVTKLFDITGKALSGEWGTDDLDGCGIPVLRTTNFTNVGKVNYDNVVTRNIQKQNISEKLLKKGDIIIEKSGGTDKNPVGRVIYFEGEENKYLFNNFTGLLRVKDKNEWYPKYVFYSMFAYYKRGGTRRFENKTTGLHNLKLDDYIKRLDIQKASYVDQVHVCKLLDCVRLQIDNMEQELELLDELVKARFVEMFGDPVTNDMLWNTDVLKDICTKIGSGSTPRGGKESYIDEGISLIRSMNVHNAYFEYKDLAHITLDQAEKLNNVVVEHDDLLFNITGASVARCCVVPSDVLPARVNQHVCILRCREKINPIFLQGLLVNENYQGKLLQIAKSGATREAINKQQLESLEIMIPPLELQNQFASFVQEIDKSRSRIQKSLEASQELFDSLMQEYFS